MIVLFFSILTILLTVTTAPPFRLFNRIAVPIRQAVRFELFSVEAMVLPVSDQGIRILIVCSRLLREQTPVLKVDVVEPHEHAHAQPLQQVNDDQEHALEEPLVVDLPARIVFVQVEPAAVREAEKGGNEGVGAAFPPQRVLDFLVLPLLPLDCLVSLYKKPDH